MQLTRTLNQTHSQVFAGQRRIQQPHVRTTRATGVFSCHSFADQKQVCQDEEVTALLDDLYVSSSRHQTENYVRGDAEFARERQCRWGYLKLYLLQKANSNFSFRHVTRRQYATNLWPHREDIKCSVR